MSKQLPPLPDGRASRIRVRRRLRRDRLTALLLVMLVAVAGFHTLEQFFVHDTYAFISP